MPEIGIIIVTYNSAAVIGSCLEAACATGAAIVVVDNASTDATLTVVKRHPVQVVANPANCGFAAAVNQGFAALNTAYVLLLNPDTVLASSLDPLREACDLPRAGGASGRLLDHEGNPQIGFMVRELPTAMALILEILLLNRLWPGNPINVKYRCKRWDYSALQPAGQPAAAFLMIRRAVWQELGGFDERFWPLWFEDVDFCRRAADRGYLFYYQPQAVAFHTGAHSIPSLSLEMRRVYWYGSLLRYSAKHFRPRGVRAICLAVVTGSCLRIFLESALQRSLKPMAVYSKVVRLAGRFLFGRGDNATASVLDH